MPHKAVRTGLSVLFSCQMQIGIYGGDIVCWIVKG